MTAKDIQKKLDVTESDLSTLDSLCERSKSAFVHFLDEDRRITSAYERASGRYFEISQLSSVLGDYSLTASPKDILEEVARSILGVIGRVSDVMSVAFDFKPNNHVLVFVAFIGNYADYIDQLSDVELECRILFRRYSMDFIPLSSFEFDRSKLPNDVIGFTRRSVGCQQDLSTKQK